MSVQLASFGKELTVRAKFLPFSGRMKLRQTWSSEYFLLHLYHFSMPGIVRRMTSVVSGLQSLNYSIKSFTRLLRVRV